ncbi:hypothetical protein BBJ28_00026576 [Nothophytophthora sp. Chile5]|nr:hypothetical protein BBJ28_00026576 [Nothophytophthora sp. Chile5]
MQIANSSSCSVAPCRPVAFADTTYYATTDCFDSDRQSYVSNSFTDDNYVLFDRFRNGNCSLKSYYETRVVVASGECLPYALSGTTGKKNISAIALVLKDGSVNVQFFGGVSCASKPKSTSTPSVKTVKNHTCYMSSHWYAGVNSPQTLSNATTGNVSKATTASSSDGDTTRLAS